MEAEFDIAPPSETVDSNGPAKQLSNKEKRKLKQLEKQQQEQEQQAAKEQAEHEAKQAEEPTPLSHKEKRQAKKRRIAAEAAGEDPDAITQPTKPAAGGVGNGAPGPLMIGGTAVGNTPARSAHGIWVGNMNFATHARELLAWFKDRGLSEIMRINMPNGKRAHENNRGFAYLDFPTETDVTVAVGLSEQNLDGRKLLIKASSDYTGRPAPAITTLPPLDPSALEPSDPSTSTSAIVGNVPANGTSAPPQTLNRTARKILNRQRNPAGPTLFLGNLGFETVVDDIRDMFDRNQKRSREWEKKQKGEKKSKKSKGKKKREEGDDSSSEEEEGNDEGSSSEEEGSEEEEDEEDKEESQAGTEDEDADMSTQKPKRDKSKKKEKGPLDLTKADTAGIRKVRLGTFEDTGKCKGWAFVDFFLPAQATRALLNLHNHSLNGRALNVEYASAEAVRRGGLGTRAASRANGAARARGGDDDEDGYRGGGGGRPSRAGGDGKRKGRDWDDADVLAAATEASTTYEGPPAARRQPRGDGFGERPKREDRAKGGKASNERAKPGAALAMAQRASEAIVQSTGRKTTFE